MKIYNLALLLLFQFPIVYPVALELLAQGSDTDSLFNPNGFNPDYHKPGIGNIVFKSTDGGQTWQDISAGLPANLQEKSLFRDAVFSNENGLYLRMEKELYHCSANSSASIWEKEVFPDERTSIAPVKAGIVAFNYDGQFLQKQNEKPQWSPSYTTFPEKEIHTVYETAGGTVFIGCDKGLFKSTNSGKTWKQVQSGGWAMKMVESNGVLIASSQKGIIRSGDQGKTWTSVLYEGGVGIDVEAIKGGFAVINYNTESETRRVRTSYDGGKTWQAIDAGLPPSSSISSIIQVGESFYCGHPDGIFKSSDQGKTWELLLPSVDNKVFNLSVSGDVIYAIPMNGGC